MENVKIASIGILFAMIGVYAGLAEFGGYGTHWLAMISYFIAAVVIVYLILTAGGIVTTQPSPLLPMRRIAYETPQFSVHHDRYPGHQYGRLL